MDFNLTHLHLLINHFPTIGTIVGLGLFVVSLLGRNDDLKRTSLTLLLIVAALALPVYMTGNAAREMIQDRPGISTPLVAKHQDAAALALVFMMITGGLSWLGLWHSQRNSRAMGRNTFAIVLVSLVTMGLMVRTATLGSEIRHAEIRPEQAEAIGGGGTVSAIGSYVVDHGWVWPTCEILHYAGLILLAGGVLVINLRILGFLKNIRLSDLRVLLPWSLFGFGINVVTGMVFFIATPTQYTQNIAFDWKIVFLLLAGINVLYFTFDKPWTLSEGNEAPIVTKVMAAAGIFLWAGVIFWGRMLPYIGNAF
jgi:uncharacterized membrane protein